ncbi:MAG: hypothetical protein ACPLYF_00200 [Fervidobacterium sp.]
MPKRSNPASKWVALTVMLILGVILVPFVVDQVQSVNTTSWTFTGVQGAKTLFFLIPFVFICGLVIYFIASLLGKT